MFRNQITICREGWYYLVVLGFIVSGAVLREINLLVILAGMMFGPFIINWWIVTFTLRKIDVRRKLPEGICAGDLLVVDLQATNARRRLSSWAVVARETIRRDEDARGDTRSVAVMFPVIPAGDSVQVSYRGRLMQRGKYQFGPLRISTRFPLGLLRRTITLPRTDSLTVCPRLGRLTPKWSQIVESKTLGSQRSRRRHGLHEGDFYGLRDWRSGDSRRWIHWRTSARHGSLTVRQFEQQRNQNLVLILDLWQPLRPTQQHVDNVELAVSFAATVIADLCRRGGSQLIVATAGGRAKRIRGAASMVLLHEAMEHLASVSADHEDLLPDLMQRTLDVVLPGTQTVLISTRGTDFRDTARFAETWDDPRKRNIISETVCCDVSNHELNEYFQVE